MSAQTEPTGPGVGAPASTDAVRALVADVPGVDDAAARAARDRLAALAVPPGAAGGLGALAVRLAGATGACPPTPPRNGLLLVAAGDHGVHAQGVTPWPQSLTTTLAGELADGSGAAAVLADGAGVAVRVLAVGLIEDPPNREGLLCARVRAGTRDLSTEDAMTAGEVAQAVAAGARTVTAAVADGTDGVLLGDAGVANTTPSAALVAALTGDDAASVTGRGSGIDEAMLAHKRDVVATALARHRDDHGADTDPWTVLASLGGLEHAALVGALLAAATARVPVVLDGVVSNAAALVCARACPAVVDHLVAGHRSTEPAAALALGALGLRPLLTLSLRIGEGTGAVVAWPLLAQAATLLTRTATLADLDIGPPA